MNRKLYSCVIAALALLTSMSASFARDDLPERAGDSVGAVYTMTNATDRNEIVIFDRDERGTLTRVGALATGGLGVGGALDPLGSQGSLALTDNKRWLLAVNAGSNDISVFRSIGKRLELVDKVASGGEFPTSLAVFHDLVYVLNAGGAPNITGFTLNHEGRLAPITGSTRALNAGVYSQVGFDPQGEAVLVSYRSSDTLLVYPIGDNGAPASSPVASASHGAAPFGFVFDARDRLLVAEAGSDAVSSYEIEEDATLQVLDPSVSNGQVATCWIAAVGKRNVFTASPGSHAISSYQEKPGAKGSLALLAGVAGTGMSPLDLAASDDGRFLYALDPGIGGIDAFQIQPDGSLIDLGPVPAGLALFAQGLVVR